MGQWIYGKNAVNAALEQPGRIEVLGMVHNDHNLEQKAKTLGIKVERLTIKDAQRLSHNGLHQGVLAYIKDYETMDLESLLSALHDDPYATIVALDGISDPHNFGAILRVCDACGFKGVIIPNKRSVSLNATVAKVSSGAINNVMVAEVSSLANTIETLKHHGYWTVATTLDKDSVDYRQPHYDTKVAIVLGNEGKGVSPLVAKRCDWKVIMPMHGVVDSLNVSCAFAVIGYEILNQRHPYRR